MLMKASRAVTISIIDALPGSNSSAPFRTFVLPTDRRSLS
jgi:hypothetical protein